MKSTDFARHLKSGMDTPCVAVLLAAGFYLLGAGCGSALVLFLFTALSTTLSLYLLHLFGYYDTVRFLPRRSSIFVLLLTVPLAAFVVVVLSHHLLARQYFSTLGILSGSIALAAAVFCAHYLFNKTLMHFGFKRNIVLDLLPEERAGLLSEFAAYNSEQYFRFVSLRDLRKAMLRKAASEIDLIITSRQAHRESRSERILERACRLGLPMLDYSEVRASLTGRVRMSDVDRWACMRESALHPGRHAALVTMKRTVEPLAAIVLSILLAPIMLAVAVMIKLSSPGPVLYRQMRTGYMGKSFLLYKFRSMDVDAERNGPQWSSGAGDARVTPVGRFLRRTRLDEIPQLLNVIRGEMGFFGPRPERPEIYRQLKNSLPLFSLRTMTQPGITGWAQVNAGYAASVAQSGIKLEYDLYYIQNMSFRMDLIILIKTFQVALFGDRSVETIELTEALPEERKAAAES